MRQVGNKQATAITMKQLHIFFFFFEKMLRKNRPWRNVHSTSFNEKAGLKGIMSDFTFLHTNTY